MREYRNDKLARRVVLFKLHREQEMLERRIGAAQKRHGPVNRLYVAARECTTRRLILENGGSPWGDA